MSFLLDQAIETHPRGQHLARGHINIGRCRNAFFDQIIGLVQNDVLQPVDQEPDNRLVQRDDFLASAFDGFSNRIDHFDRRFRPRHDFGHRRGVGGMK